MKKMLQIILWVIGLILVAALLLGLYAWREIGESPSKEELKAYEALPYFKDGKFHGAFDIAAGYFPFGKQILYFLQPLKPLLT